MQEAASTGTLASASECSPAPLAISGPPLPSAVSPSVLQPHASPASHQDWSALFDSDAEDDEEPSADRQQGILVPAPETPTAPADVAAPPLQDFSAMFDSDCEEDVDSPVGLASSPKMPSEVSQEEHDSVALLDADSEEAAPPTQPSKWSLPGWLTDDEEWPGDHTESEAFVFNMVVDEQQWRMIGEGDFRRVA